MSSSELIPERPASHVRYLRIRYARRARPRGQLTLCHTLLSYPKAIQKANRSQNPVSRGRLSFRTFTGLLLAVALPCATDATRMKDRYRCRHPTTQSDSCQIRCVLAPVCRPRQPNPDAPKPQSMGWGFFIMVPSEGRRAMNLPGYAATRD